MWIAIRGFLMLLWQRVIWIILKNSKWDNAWIAKQVNTKLLPILEKKQEKKQDFVKFAIKWVKICGKINPETTNKIIVELDTINSFTSPKRICNIIIKFYNQKF